MKIAEVKVERKLWEIEVHTNKLGHKFIKAKCTTIYGVMLEVQLYKMPDGFVIAYEVNNNLIDNETMAELRKILIDLRNEYCKRGR